MPGWPRATGFYWLKSSPALGDLDGDGRLEVVIGAFDHYVYVRHSDGTAAAGWPQATGDRIQSSPALGDLDGDGSPEVVIGSFDGKVYAWHANGTAVAGWPQTTGDRVYGSPALGDLDGDGKLEVVVGSFDRKVYAWHANGTLLAGWPQSTGDWVFSSPALGDLDGDGKLEVVVGSHDGKVYAWHGNGTPLAGWPQSTGDIVYGSPALGDLDGDGSLEVAVGCYDHKVYVWRGNGTLLAGWPQSTGDQVLSSPALGDLDGDGSLEVVVGSFDNQVYAWHAEGTLVTGWPQATAAWVYSSPALGDLDGDGDVEVVAASHDNNVYVWSCDTPTMDTLPWPTFHHDARRTGRAEAAPGRPRVRAHFSADEGSGTVLGDSSGLGNNGTIYGASWVSGAGGGYALHFNGIGDHVVIPDADSLDISEQLTLEAWIRPGPGDWGGVVVAKQGAYALAFQAEGSSGRIIGIIRAGGSDHWLFGTDNSVPADGTTWTKVAVTYDSTSRVLRLYVNGAEDAALTLSGLSSYVLGVSGNQVELGALYGTYPFWGDMDEVRIVQGDLYTLGDVCRLSFEEGSGAVARDSSGFGNDAAVYGANWTVVSRVGGGLWFNGSSSFLRVPASSSLNVSSELTVEAWIRPERSTEIQLIAAKPGSYGLVLLNDRVAGIVDLGTAWIPAISNSRIPTDGSTWTHVRMTYRASTATMEIAINGRPDVSWRLSGLPSYTIALSTENVYIGGPSPYCFLGEMDQLRISSTAR
jgi:WD40 repeat protein